MLPGHFSFRHSTSILRGIHTNLGQVIITRNVNESWVGTSTSKYFFLTCIVIVFENTLSASDDKVDEDNLATAFDVTCRAWTVRTRRYIVPTKTTLIVAN